MTRIIIAAALAALVFPVAPAPVQAGPIETACARSDRAGGNRALCRCIQSVADQTLSRGEQRKAARFFRDPQRAQDTRTSSSDRDNAFWRRYTAFGSAAERHCAT